MTKFQDVSGLCLAVALVAVLGVVAGPAGAGPTDEHAAATPKQAHDAHEDTGDHDAHGERLRNGLAVFLGGTLVGADDQTFLTLGAEHERILSGRWGFQVVVEYVRDFDAWVVTAPVGFRVVDALWFLAGPGLEIDPRSRRLGPFGAGRGTVGHSVEPHEEEGPYFLWRFGLAYGLHLRHDFALMPSVSLDLVREHGGWERAWVLGVGLTYHF